MASMTMTPSLPFARENDQALLLTSDDFRDMALPEPWRYQLVEGVLYKMPNAPSRFHQKISGNLFWFIESYLRSNRIGELYAAPFYVELDRRNVFQPDLAFVSKARASILVPEGVQGAPDLIVEILSPSTAHLDVEKKLPIYARAGVLELWIVDPDVRRLFLYDLAAVSAGAHGLTVFEVGRTVSSARLPGFSVAVADIFAQDSE